MSTLFRLFGNLLIVGIFFAFISCTSTLQMQVLKPGAISVDPNIKSIALVNRTKPMSKAANVIEGILSGEGLYQDREGVENALVGLKTALQSTPRFQVINTSEFVSGSGAGASFPPPLKWEEVERICNGYNADIICTIETYDSDTRIVTTRNVTQRKNRDGKYYDYVEFASTQTVTVQLGFRLYDPVTKNIIDEFHFVEQNNWTSVGTSEYAALAGLYNKRAATNQVSNAAGVKYGIRIAPSWMWISRDFYTKGKHDKMKPAGKLGKVNKWEEARAMWLEIYQNTDRKTAGRACFNIAISYEYEGNLNEAKVWAQRAYTDYGNKNARSYVTILNQRLQDCAVLERQMK